MTCCRQFRLYTRTLKFRIDVGEVGIVRGLDISKNLIDGEVGITEMGRKFL